MRVWPVTSAVQRVRNEICTLESLESNIKILDLGFGKGGHWNGEVPWDNLTVIDSSDTWLSEATVLNKPDCVHVGVIPDCLDSFPSKSFDVVIAFDLIEHLPKHEGYRMLYQMQRIARHFAMVYTPNGLVWQPGARNNPSNAHISGWKAKEFRDLGWSPVKGEVGPKIFWDPYMTWKYPNFRGIRVNNLALRLLRSFPNTCFALSAIWRPSNRDWDPEGL